MYSYLKSIPNPLDPEKFAIQYFQFETDNRRERYKVVWQYVHDFVESLGLLHVYILPLLQAWHNGVFANPAKPGSGVVRSKGDIIWPIIVLETDLIRSDPHLEDISAGLYDEVVHQYGEIINSSCERFELVIQVLWDYRQFKDYPDEESKLRCFVNAAWQNYEDIFRVEVIDAEDAESVKKLTLYNILRRANVARNMKEAIERL